MKFYLSCFLALQPDNITQKLMGFRFGFGCRTQTHTQTQNPLIFGF